MEKINAAQAKKYPVEEKAQSDIDKRFTYHSPKEDQPARYVAIRDTAKALAVLIAESTPPSREQSLALTKLEEAVIWANAGIARNE